MNTALLLDAPHCGAHPDADAVITLSAFAEYCCRRGGVRHQDSSAVVSEEQLAALQDDYWDAQVEWLWLLERKLLAAAPSLTASAIRPIAASGYLLKALVDALFVRAFESAGLTAGQWSHLTHCVRPSGPQLLRELLPLFCDARSIGYTQLTGEDVQGGAAATRLQQGRIALTSAMRQLGQLASARPANADPDTASLRLLLLSRGYDLADLMLRNAEAGGESLVVVHGRVVELRRSGPRVLGRVPTADDAARREWRGVATVLSADPDLRAWPSSWFEGEVGDFVVDRVAGWVEREMPDILAAASWFERICDEQAVDAVVAPYCVTAPEIGAFAAAKASERAKAVLIEHGDIAHAALSGDLTLLASDVLVVPMEELREHYESRRKAYEHPTAEVVVGSYRWPRYAQLARPRRTRRDPVVPPVEPPGQFDAAKPTLIYLVTALSTDYRLLNNAWYPDPWYFGLQAAIVQALVPHERFNVVVKVFPTTEHDVSPLARYVAELDVPHVMTSRAPFSEWIPLADRVVADLASTGLYESVISGTSTLGLLWTHHPARPGALSALGDALKTFETHDEAAALVAKFAAESSPEVPEVKPQGRDILDSLVDLCTRPAAGGSRSSDSAI